MWLQRIAMKNFKPYRGLTEIIFEQTCSQKRKHIFGIYGDNGFGKTSILDAIYWGLYGSRGRNTKLVFNDKALNEKDAEMFVELTFYDEVLKKTYIIIRKAIKKGHNIKESLEVLVDGEAIISDVLYKQDFIDQLIPYEISRFFFFDAEDVKTLAREQGGEMVRDSVELLLGLKSIREAINDLENVRWDLEKLRKKQLDNEKHLRSLSEELDRINTQLGHYKKRKEEIKKELADKKARLAELRRELAQSSYEEIRNLEDTRQKLEEKLERLEKIRENIKKEIEENSTSLHLLILKPELLDAKEQLEKKLSELQREQEKLRKLNFIIKSLEETLNESKCSVCGRIIFEEYEIRQLQEQLKELKEEHPQVVDKLKEIDKKHAYYNHIYSQLLEKLRKIERIAISSVYESRIKLKETEEEINQVKRQIKQISEKLKNVGIAIINQIEKKISQLEREIGKLEKELQKVTERIEELTSEKNKIEKKLKRRISSGSELSEIEAKIGLVDTLKNALKEYLDIVVEKRRQDIIRTSSDIFLELTNKKDEYAGFEFSSKNNYKFQIVCKDGSRPNMDTISYGEMEVVALSFILGLNKYSQVKAPIITDTLFGRLSPYVQENIAKLFSEMENQIILLVLKDERPNGKTEIDSIAPIFKDKICKEFIIVRNQVNRESSIFEANVLVGE